MFYFYLGLGKSKPYLISDMTSSRISAPGVHSDAVFPPWPGIFVKVEFGVSKSPIDTPGRQLTWDIMQNLNQHGQSRALVPGNNYYLRQLETSPHNQRRRRIRSRSALQLRAGPIPPPAARINAPLDEPAQVTPHHHPAGGLPYFPPQQSSRPQPSQPPSRPSQPAYREFYAPAPQPQPSWLAQGHADIAQQPQSYSWFPGPAQTSQPSHPAAQRLRNFPPARRQSTIDRKPLPPLPNRYRLGEDDLPWQTAMDMPSWLPEEDIYSASSPATIFAEPAHMANSSPMSPPSRGRSPARTSDRGEPSPMARTSYSHSFSSGRRGRDSIATSYRGSVSTVSIGRGNGGNVASDGRERASSEDPQRIRDLEALHQAMMTIDSLENDWWGPVGSWESQGDVAGLPRGPLSIGWAIRVEPVHQDSGIADMGDVGDVGMSGMRSSMGSGSAGWESLSPPPHYVQGAWDWDVSGYYGGLRRSRSTA